MATYKQLELGAQGEDVVDLQKRLNSKGNYNLDTDGIFGQNTLAAVKDYQKKNGLDVDGVAGEQTWGALTGANTPASTAPAQPTASTAKPWSYEGFKISDATAAADKKRQDLAAQKPGDFTYGAYEKSDIVKQAEAMLQQQLAGKPGAYVSPWQTQLNDIIDKINNREKFSYDLNGDALYQQYKDQYVTQGQQAMMDTMGQAQTMTGGYGNSYAQTAGQQTYQGYLQQLNDRVPELYQLALDQYNQKGQDLYNQYGLYADRENQDYGRYRDTVSDYYTELDRLTEDARYKAEQDYGKWMDKANLDYGIHRDQVSDWQQEQARADEDYWDQYNRDYGAWQDKTKLDYGIHRDTVADQQWQTEFDEAQRQYKEKLQYQKDRDTVQDKQWQAEFDEAKRQYDLNYALKDKPGTGGGPTIPDTVLSALKTKYPNGTVTNLTEWDTMVSQYGEEALKAAGYTVDIDYNTIVDECNEYIRIGWGKSEISAYLRAAYQEKFITQEEYNKLKEMFTPRGNTY